MASPNNEDELMDSVPLSEETEDKEESSLVNESNVPEQSESPTEPTPEAPQAAAATPPVTDDPWAIPDGALESEQQDEDDEDVPTDTQEALGKLRTSSVRLGKALDQTVGFTKTWAQLSTKAKEVDDKAQISDTARKATATVGGWWSTLDQSLGVSSATAEFGQALQEHVVAPLQQQSQPVIQKSTRKLQELDEQHQITTTTAESLTRGADFLTKSLVGDGGTGISHENNHDESGRSASA